jgi:choline dehydrogenase-like flavoprotein
MSYVRLSADSPPFSQEGFPDPSGGNLSAHIEFNFYSINNQSTGSQNGTLMLYVINLHPVSREHFCLLKVEGFLIRICHIGGSVTLNDSNPFHYPVINFGFLAEPMDVSILREGVRSARRLLSAPAFQDSVFGTVAPASNVTSDEDLEAFLHSTADNWGHAVGSASMSPQGADWGVVDPDFRVKGTSGLRAVDASVIVSPGLLC